MTVHFLLHSRNGLELHKPHCAEITRAKKTGDWNNDWVEELPSGDLETEALKAMNASFGWVEGEGENAPWFPGTIRILPCTRGLK